MNSLQKIQNRPDEMVAYSEKLDDDVTIRFIYYHGEKETRCEPRTHSEIDIYGVIDAKGNEISKSTISEEEAEEMVRGNIDSYLSDDEDLRHGV